MIGVPLMRALDGVDGGAFLRTRSAQDFGACFGGGDMGAAASDEACSLSDVTVLGASGLDVASSDLP